MKIKAEITMDIEMIWSGCGGCEDFICNVHNKHVSDCLCPSVEIWEEEGLSPYLTVATPEILKWINDNPFIDE